MQPRGAPARDDARSSRRRLDQLQSLWSSPGSAASRSTAWEAIEELAPFFHEVAERHEIPFNGHMTTNGYLLTPDVAEKLFSWRVPAPRFTLDGAPEDHDQSRSGRDGSGTFAQIYENLLSIAKRPEHFDITVRINVSPANAPRITELLDSLQKDLGGDPQFNLSFQPVSRWGGKNDANLEVCGTEDRSRLMSDLLAAAKKRGLNLPRITHVNRFGSNICYAARPYNYLIGAAGQVMKCTILLDKDPANVVGTLTAEGELHPRRRPLRRLDGAGLRARHAM